MVTSRKITKAESWPVLLQRMTSLGEGLHKTSISHLLLQYIKTDKGKVQLLKEECLLYEDILLLLLKFI